jgi:DnaK suppressor protein
MTDLKVRYSDEDLLEFKELIEQKLITAKEELDMTQRQIADLNENGFNQQGGDWYDDSTAHTDLEMLQRMSQRQLRYVTDLQNALLRIHNKTYGICSITGKLIDKSRLRLVPHATKSIDGKQIANSGVRLPGSETSSDPFGLPEAERSLGKPIGDKVRMNNVKRPGGGEDWEIDNETLENANGYSSGRKYEDEDER